MLRKPGDGPRYLYHAKEPAPGDYCLKRGPLPFLWHVDKGGYSGWSALAIDVELQQNSLRFDRGRAKAIIESYRSKLEKSSFSLIPQPDATIETEIADLDDLVFYPLQVNNDTVLKLADCPQFALIRAAGTIADRYRRHLVIKRHPLCKSETVLAAINDVIESPFVHLSTGPTAELIRRASRVMLTNSSVGVQSLILNTPVFAFGGSEYAHMTTRLEDAEGVEQVFLDAPRQPHDAYAGGIAYLLSEYLVDMNDSERIFKRIESQVKECRHLVSMSKNATSSKASSAEDFRNLSLKRALEREVHDLLDFVLMVYSDLKGDQKVRIARMLSRLARSGISTDRIIKHTDAAVSNRCLTYLKNKNDRGGLMRIARARLKTEPCDWRAAHMLAKAHYALKQNEAGLEVARKTAETNGAPSSAKLFFARRLWNALETPDATVKKIVSDVIQLEPENDVANWLQARIFFADNKMAEARVHIEAACHANPGNVAYQRLQTKILKICSD